MTVLAVAAAGSEGARRGLVGRVTLATVKCGADNSIFTASPEHDVALKQVTGDVVDAAGARHPLWDCVGGHFISPSGGC